MSNPIMEGAEDELALVRIERNTWAQNCLKAREEIATLRAERDALAERLRLQPTVREIVGDLRTARDWLEDGAPSLALKRLNEVLRRLDESQ